MRIDLLWRQIALRPSDRRCFVCPSTRKKDFVTCDIKTVAKTGGLQETKIKRYVSLAGCIQKPTLWVLGCSFFFMFHIAMSRCKIPADRSFRVLPLYYTGDSSRPRNRQVPWGQIPSTRPHAQNKLHISAGGSASSKYLRRITLTKKGSADTTTARTATSTIPPTASSRQCMPGRAQRVMVSAA